MMYRLYKTSPEKLEPDAVMTFGVDPQVSFLMDPANTDYQQYLSWLDEGNTPEPAPVPEITWDSIREKRDQLIKESDWTMIPGATVDQHAWAVYRQILRDIPQTFAATGPQSVSWPERPSTIGPNQKAAEYAEAIKAEIEGVKIDEDSTAS